MEHLAAECDIAVVGGSMGGVAAAVAAARAGYRVCLTEETQWLGGQATSQGVSALDEHEHIERFGGTALYYEFRNRIRDFYARNYELSPLATTDGPYLNPGAGWVSRLCFEPRAALSAILDMTVPLLEQGLLRIHYGAAPHRVERTGDRIDRVLLSQPAYGRRIGVRAAYFLDATELGDLLPLAGVPYVTGAETRDDTGEPHARPDSADPQLTQAFTFPFVVDFRPGEDHTIPEPPDYARHRVEQPYTLTLRYGTRDLTYRVFDRAPELPGAFWTYRRILAADRFGTGLFPGDLAMINWSGNDYAGGSIIDCTPDRRSVLLREARNLSLGLLHWLQTQAPRDDGQGCGYPEMRLRRDVLGTADGLSQFPYVRESRRIRAQVTVREQDVLAEHRTGARAAPFDDSVGLGWYPMDIHGRPGDVAAAGPTRPFQIPLGSLLQTEVNNLLPACKNLGVTHMTNGCYRLHPVEWNVGESAARLAVYCLQRHVRPMAVRSDSRHLRALQRALIESGVPLFWYSDAGEDQTTGAAAQLLALNGLWVASDTALEFAPDTLVTPDDLTECLSGTGLDTSQIGADIRTRGRLARLLARRLLNWSPDGPKA